MILAMMEIELRCDVCNATWGLRVQPPFTAAPGEIECPYCGSPYDAGLFFDCTVSGMTFLGTENEV